MLTDANVPGSRIKVITENGIVYLLGLVTQKEANSATNVVQASRACRRSSSCSNTSTDPVRLPTNLRPRPSTPIQETPHEKVLLPALLIGTFATLAGCSPSVITSTMAAKCRLSTHRTSTATPASTSSNSSTASAPRQQGPGTTISDL
jgi:hypothetical protein